MSENNLEEIQNLLRNIQKVMMAKAATVRGQWNSITCLEKISQVQLARRLNSLGINATNIEVSQLFYYLGIKRTGLGFNDFITLMETDPSSLGPKTRKISQKNDIEHETLRAYEDDYNTYCRRTVAFTPSIQTRNSSKKITRPFTSKGTNNSSQLRSSRRQKNANRPSINTKYTEPDEQEENIYASTNDNNNDNPVEDVITFSYEPCKTILERSLPRNSISNRTRNATLQSFSNTAIQRQFYDGTDAVDASNQEAAAGMTIKELVTKISESAYVLCKNSRECFYKWRDPHHEQLDATDLRNGLKHDNKVEISQADAQRVIDRYGGPMNLSTFAIMLHDGSHFNPNKSFGYDDI